MISTILNMSDDSNKGDLAIMESTIWLVKKHFPKTKICVLNVDYSDSEIKSEGKFKHLRNLSITHYGSFSPVIFKRKRNLYGLLLGIKSFLLSIWILSAVFFFKKYSYFLIPKKHKRAFYSILSADLVILKGGSYIFSYGGLKQFLFLYRMLFSSLISIFLKKKIIALGHSIGPATGKFSKKMMKFCLEKFEKIIVRERISYNFVLHELNIEKKKVELLPDLAFWHRGFDLNAAKEEIHHIIKDEGIKFDNLSEFKVGLTARRWHFPLQKNSKELFRNYIDALVKVMDKLYLKYKAEIFIMPHVLEDIAVGKEIAKKTKYAHPFVLKGDYSTSMLRKIYGMMDLFIGTRTHSNIFALSSGVPVIAIAYEIPKGVGIVSMIEKEDCIIDIAKINGKVLWDRVEKLFNKKEMRKETILKKVALFKREIENVSF